MGSLLFLIIVVVLAIWLVRKLAGGSRGSTGRARAGRARPDLSTAALVQSLQAGTSPGALPVSFPLQPGETCVGTAQADVEQWLEGDGVYTHKSVGWAGGLTGLALGGALNAAGNAKRKAAARREAAERWRLVGHYRIYFTTARIALENGRDWSEIWLSDIRRIELEQGGIAIYVVAGTPARIHAAPSDYWLLLLRWLAFGEIPRGQMPA